MGEVIQIDQAMVREHLDQVVRSTVEETLNALLDAEADKLCGAKRYEHSADRVDTRAGHYERQLHTNAGEVTLQVPKLRSHPAISCFTLFRKVEFRCSFCSVGEPRRNRFSGLPALQP